MDLHGQIMNLQNVEFDGFARHATQTERIARKEGHRDARHAAAELALKADAAMLEAAQIIKELCQCYGHPTPDATLTRLLGGA